LDTSHNQDDTQIDVLGYESCKNTWCSEIVLKEVAKRTKGFCSGCWQNVFNSEIAEIEIRARSERIKMPVKSKTKPNRKKGNRERQKAVEKARLRAMKRLRAVFPDLYDIFLAEERARAGLEPWPLEMTLKPVQDEDGSETVDFAEVYHHLQQAGVEFDAPSSKRKNL